jgi:molecular chaperone GrpE
MTGKKIEVQGPKAKDAAEIENEAAPDEAVPAPGGNGEPVAETAVQEPAPKVPDVKEVTDHLLRLAAEFDNYKKRTAREMQAQQDSGMARVMSALLPGLDSLALSLAIDATGQDAQAWRAGLEKVGRQWWEALEKLGLALVEPGKGDLLDPRVHQVLMTQPTTEYPTDRILQVLQVGYKLKDRLLRPATVVVAAAPPAPAVAENKENE